MSNVISISDLQLDNTIQLVPASGVNPEYYAADNGIVRSEFYSTGNKVVFQSKGRSFAWTPSAMKYVDEFGVDDVIYNVQDVPLETKANYARFNRAMPDVDDWFIQENDKLKHQILIQGFQRDPLPWLSGNIDFVFGGRIEFDPDLQVRANGLVITGAFETGEGIEIIDSNGETLFTLPRIVAYDSKIPDRAMTYGKYRVNSNAGGVLEFDIVVDNAWVSSVDRVYPIVIDPTVVVASAYDITTPCARKIVTMSDSSLVCVAFSGTNVLYFYRSTDSGATWSANGFISIATAYFAIASTGTYVHIAASNGGTQMYWFRYNPSTNGNAQITGGVSIDNTVSSVGPGVSILLDASGYCHIAWCAKESAYANSFNIRYSKSTDGGTTWTTTRLTSENATGTDSSYPSMVWNGTFPMILYSWDVSSNYSYIRCLTQNAAPTWNTYNVYTSAFTYRQYYPVAIYANSKLWVTWAGSDSTDTTQNNIHYGYSTDSGATWTTAKLTSGNTYAQAMPNIATDTSNNNIAILWHGRDAITPSYNNLYMNVWTGSAFQGQTKLTANTTNHALYVNPQEKASSIYKWIYLDQQTSSIKYDYNSTNTAPNAPTLTTEPNFDATTAQTFQWTFSDPDAGNTQSAYQLIIIKVSDGSTSLDSGKVASTTSSHSLSANALTNGNQYQWKVRTWDNSDAVGPYSGLGSFYASAKPTTTVTAPISDGTTISVSSLTSEWSFSDPESEGQSAYQVKLTTSADVVLFDSGKVSSVAARALTISYTLVNSTNYKVKITTWDAKDIASTEAVRTFITSFTVPATPTLVATAQTGYIGLTITNPTPAGAQPLISYNDLYRRVTGTTAWMRIATALPNNGTYSDYAAASDVSYEYYVQANGNNGTSANSSTASCSITLTGVWLHDVLNPLDTIHRYALDGRGRDVSWEADVTMMQFAGRSRPVAEFSESGEGKITQQLQLMKDGIDLASLRSLVQLKPTVCYRDGRGRKMFGIISKLPETDEFWGYSTTLEVTENAYTEVV